MGGGILSPRLFLKIARRWFKKTAQKLGVNSKEGICLISQLTLLDNTRQEMPNKKPSWLGWVLLRYLFLLFGSNTNVKVITLIHELDSVISIGAEGNF